MSYQLVLNTTRSKLLGVAKLRQEMRYVGLRDAWSLLTFIVLFVAMTLCNVGAGRNVLEYYENFVSASNIKAVLDVAANHTFVRSRNTTFFASAC